MPTPVGVARQCLTPDAAHALDEAVSVARRRGHAQTTSLHAVSALLSLSSSTLRDACARARNSAYSPRLQFKALELCLSVSLERVPSGQLTDDPPISNSLMAAIKRSQANQRRQPENFHLYHQLSNQSSINAIKVELQHLILSILDDPVVSRVFCEAGFKSSEIKLAIVRPLPHLFRYARSRGPPLFLCNLGENSGIGSGRPGFNFPFSVFPGFSDVDENVRRIGEVLVRSKGRNPLLVGVCACDALKSFVEALDKRKDGSLPEEVSGLSVVSIENDVSKFAGEDFDKGCVDVKFEELNEAIRQCSGAGLMVNFGDLRAFVGGGGDGESSEEAVSYVVDRLTKLLDTNKEGKKVWLIGAAASYDTYLKFLTKFPSTEKEWDMQILPITTLRPTTAAESCSRSSLMESFVPFAGFFSTSSDFSSPLMSMSYQCVSPCHMYNDKCDRETGAATNVGFTASVADRYQSSLPSWMQMSELGTKGTDVKRKDDNVDKSMKDLGLQSESDAGSQSSKNEPLSEVQTVVGFHSAEEERKETIDNQSIKIKSDSSANEMRCRSVDSCMSMESEKVLTSQLGIHSPLVAKNKESFLSKLLENSSRIEDRDSGAAGSPKFSMSNSSIDDGSRTSPASVTSVTISLGSGIHSTSDNSELKKHTNPISCPIPTRSNLFSGTVCGSLAESSSSLYPLACSPVDQQDFKKIFGDLFRKVGRQVEAMNVISHTISSCRSRNSSRSRARGDMWFAFLGPDRVGKRKTAVALSETLRGSKEDLIFVDLSVQDGSPCTDMILNQEMNQYESKYRGKTVVDIIAGELIKKPRSVVLLENVDKADEQVQSSLYQAIFTGKFSDSHGREVSIKNTVFVATSSFTKGDGILCSEQESAQLREERMLGAKRCQMKILVDNAVVDDTISSYPPMSVTSGTSITSQLQVNKRKLTGPSENVVLHECSHVVKRANKTWSRHLDLNLPAEGGEVVDQTTECDVMPENTKAWLLDFLDKMDSSVEFKPYDFDPLVEKVLKEIKESFDETVGTECLLEIDPKVMDQLVAVVYVSDSEKTVVDWVRQILKSEFSEVRRRHKLMPRSVVKLLACEDVFLEDQEPRNCLPTRLIVN